MKINITTSEIKNTNLITKVKLVLFSVFLTSVIFGLTIQFFSTKGIWIGTLTALALSAAGIYYCPKGSYRRLISWGMIGTLVLGALAFFITISFISSSLEGL